MFCHLEWKILVTGSSGHLGEAIIRTLQHRKIDYVSVDLKPSPFTTHIGSIVDKLFVDEVMRGVDYVIHTATLHKPHIVTHSHQDFIATNITGTLNLLEAAEANGGKGFIFTSTTSTFGDALRPEAGSPATWITEETQPISKNIYGMTKLAAEDLCRLFYRNQNLPCLILKTSRFFLEVDDDPQVRDQYSDLNIKALEYLYRRADIEDIVEAHLLAIEQVADIGFEKYIISATSPFQPKDLPLLNIDAPEVVRHYYPSIDAIFEANNWQLLPTVGRVYVNEKARKQLGWQPKYDFQYVLHCLVKGKDFRSELARQVGVKGYHEEVFEDGLYPIAKHS
ncbi:MAG: NAD(P)-dependent oxidoreductase [Bacteroidota bacterium]